MPTFSEILVYLAEFLVIVWFLAALANKSKRGELKNTISELVTTPTVYKPSENEVKIDLYPRTTLESAASGWKDWFVTPAGKAFATVKDWFEKLRQDVFPKESNIWKGFNYFTILILFAGYLYADAINVMNTLESFGLVKSIDEALKRYDISILFGSLISVVLGGVIANDIFANGDFTDWESKKESKWIGSAKFSSRFLIISGLYVITSLGAARFGRLIFADDSIVLYILNLNGQFVIHVLTPLNAGIATFLIADDGLSKGFRIVWLAGISALVAILAILWYVLGAIYGTVVYIVDILWRFMLGVGNIIFFLALTPLDEVADLVKNRMAKK